MTTEEPLIPVFMPTLAALLMNREQEKGAPLTEAEVLEIRDTAIVMMMPESQADAMNDARGYLDIDPENCWQEWQQLRLAD
jgi:hypothetical protein